MPSFKVTDRMVGDDPSAYFIDANHDDVPSRAIDLVYLVARARP